MMKSLGLYLFFNRRKNLRGCTRQGPRESISCKHRARGSYGTVQFNKFGTTNTRVKYCTIFYLFIKRLIKDNGFDGVRDGYVELRTKGPKVIE